MKCGLLHLIYFEMGCGILDFSVSDSIFFSFESLAFLIFSFEGLLLLEGTPCK